MSINYIIDTKLYITYITISRFRTRTTAQYTAKCKNYLLKCLCDGKCMPIFLTQKVHLLIILILRKNVKIRHVKIPNALSIGDRGTFHKIIDFISFNIPYWYCYIYIVNILWIIHLILSLITKYSII